MTISKAVSIWNQIYQNNNLKLL